MTFPQDLLRPVNVHIKEKGARIAFRPSKDIDESEVVSYRIFRSQTYDYNSQCSALESGKFTDLKVYDVEQSPFIDTQFPKKNTRYTYYIFAVDKEGDYHFPGVTTGKVAELGITLQEAKPGQAVEGVIGGVEPIEGQGSYLIKESEVQNLMNALKGQKGLWNERREKWTEGVLDALEKRDEQGYWVAVKMGEIAPEVFLTFVDATEDLTDNCAILVHELTHIGSRRQVVIYDSDIGSKGRAYILLIDDAAWGVQFPKQTFFREEILSELPEYEGKGEYAQHYLVESGKQDFFTLLNELNAYCRELRTRIGLSDQQIGQSQENRTVTHAVCIFMLYTEVFLRVARTKFKKDWDMLTKFPEIGLMVLKIWHNCEFLIQEALKYEKGHDSVYELVDREDFLSEITGYAEACGLDPKDGAKSVDEIKKLKQSARLVIKKP